MLVKLQKMNATESTNLPPLKSRLLRSPVKPAQDKKLYRAIELPNGLKALLVGVISNTYIRLCCYLCFHKLNSPRIRQVSDPRHDFALLDSQEEFLSVNSESDSVSCDEIDDEMNDSEDEVVEDLYLLIDFLINILKHSKV